MNTILLVKGEFIAAQEICTLEQAPLALAKMRAVYPSLFRDETKLTLEWGAEHPQAGQTRTQIGLDGLPIQQTR